MNFNKIALFAITATTIFLVTACSVNTVTEDSLGIRNTSLYTEDKTIADQTKYATTLAGESKNIDRAFENAPPMIPHDIEGMLPISLDNNQCVACHDPLVAESVNATSYPQSHVTNFREQISINKDGDIVREGKVLPNSSDIITVSKPLDMLSNSRFVCSSCHAPQSESAIVPKNNFAPEFRTTGLNAKSNLVDTMNEGVK